jgi:hypothetical protein
VTGAGWRCASWFRGWFVGHAEWQVCISRGGGAPAEKRGRLVEETHHHTTQAPSSTTCTPQTPDSGTPADLFLEWRSGRMPFPGDCMPPAGMGRAREKRRSSRHRSTQWVCGGAYDSNLRQWDGPGSANGRSSDRTETHTPRSPPAPRPRPVRYGGHHRIYFIGPSAVPSCVLCHLFKVCRWKCATYRLK